MGKGKKEKTKQNVKTKPDKKKSGKKWGQTTKERDIIKRDVFIADEIKKTMDEEVPKMREITVSKISMKYNIVQSIAKKYLEDLYKQKKIKLIARNSRISIYTSLNTVTAPAEKKKKPKKAKKEEKPKAETATTEAKPKKEAKAKKAAKTKKAAKAKTTESSE